MLWLLTGQRGQSLTLIDTRNITLTKNSLKIRFGDLLKTSRPDFQQQEIETKGFAPAQRLRVVTVVKEYLTRSEKLSGSETQLFVACQEPYLAVSRNTISRWVKEVMAAAGVDIKIFTPLSLRAASASAALRANVPIDTIGLLCTAGRSSESIFTQYCNKPVVKEKIWGLLCSGKIV